MKIDSNGVRLCSIKSNAELVLIYQSECGGVNVSRFVTLCDESGTNSLSVGWLVID